MTTHIPVVSFAPWREGTSRERAEIAQEVDDALRTVGFLLLADTGGDPQLPQLVRRAAGEFFALPVEDKNRYAVRVGGRGWIPPGAEANSYSLGNESPPDLKETFKVGHEDSPGLPSNVWPTEVAALRTPVEDYLSAMRQLAGDVLALFEAALNLPAGQLTVHTQGSPASLNLNYYPPLHQTGAPAPGQFRIGAHSDFGTLTILDRQPGYGGLQVQTLEGEWIDAPYVPGALTINIGDLLARWTGDRWRSTMHRVLPPDPQAADEALLSLVYFFSVNPDTVIRTLPVGGPNRYDTVRAGDYLASKLESIDVA